MLRLASFALVLFAAAPAFAQSGPPGEATPVVVAAAAPELPRWSIGLDLSSISLGDKSSPDAKSQWGGGGIQIGYRLFPRWELGLDLTGATEKLADGSDGRRLSLPMLTAKWHPSPYARWDFYALAGLGAAAIFDANDTNPKADRASAALGVGVERRFGHLGISAELRAIGISPVNADDRPQAMPLASTTTTSPIDQGYGGGSFALAAAYEF
jgi:outer membrane protein with beta-barrel domain